eukprot:6082005-Prymnesium_polylepis.1
MESQITAEFKEKWLQYTREHCFAYRRKYPAAVKRNIEASMKHFYRKLKAAHFDLWIAVRLRVAQLKPEVPCDALWDPDDSLFDAEVFGALTFFQYQWLNRHASFADYGMATANAQLGDPAFDSKRKRRELTNLLSVGFGKAYRPHQHVGLDEATREHKHWGKMRIRFKAAVHSGALVDSLNDCQT